MRIKYDYKLDTMSIFQLACVAASILLGGLSIYLGK